MTPPNRTTRADSSTPARKRFPITFSTLRSVHSTVPLTSDSSYYPLVDHLQPKEHNDHAEYKAQRARFGLNQHACSEQQAEPCGHSARIVGSRAVGRRISTIHSQLCGQLVGPVAL